MADLDHRLMRPPFLRVAQRIVHENVSVYQWDLRIAQPNVTHLDLATVHSVEHFLGVGLRALTPSVITVAPMGCVTGFYITALNIGDFSAMSELVATVLREVEHADRVPLADVVQCGWAEYHSLSGAKNVAGWLLSRVADWSRAEEPKIS
ncbi:MAG: S-ribosylhomocysteine lyase [Angustibacter sp.]